MTDDPIDLDGRKTAAERYSPMSDADHEGIQTLIRRAIAGMERLRKREERK